MSLRITKPEIVAGEIFWWFFFCIKCRRSLRRKKVWVAMRSIVLKDVVLPMSALRPAGEAQQWPVFDLTEWHLDQRGSVFDIGEHYSPTSSDSDGPNPWIGHL